MSFIRKLMMGILIISFVASPGLARHKKRTRTKAKAKSNHGQLMISIRKAKKRSDKDQQKYRNMVEMEDDERRNGWTARDFNAIEIRRGGVSTLEAAELGAPDFSMEDLGEDHSGLKGLKSDVDEEPIYIDFDEELREVSSTKD